MSDADGFVEITDVRDLTVVRFLVHTLDESNLAQFDRLFRLVDQEGKKNLLLNCAEVEFVTSAALGKLITLSKKAKGKGGRMNLVHFRPRNLPPRWWRFGFG